MDWLEPPFRFWHPEPGEPFVLRVIRWKIGLAEREVGDPPERVIRPTIRFYLPEGESPAGGLYVDFTNRILMNRILAVYDDLAKRVPGRLLDDGLRWLEAVSPEREQPLILRLTRHGRGLETVYDVEVVGV